MAILDIRQHAGYLLLAVVVGHILLISAQVNSRRGVPIIEAVAFGTFAEAQRGVSGGLSAIRGLWSRYIGLRRADAENRLLKAQLAAAQLDAQEQRALADRARSLERLLALRDRTNLQTIAAEIIQPSRLPHIARPRCLKKVGKMSSSAARRQSRTEACPKPPLRSSSRWH